MAVDGKNHMELVGKVNEMLLRGEPENISYDTYSGYSGYKPQAVIDAMNLVFGLGGWGYDEISSTLDAKGALVVAKAEVWLSGVDFHPKNWGQARVTKGDEGDARKGALTDAIKKALSYFSIGNRAYHGLLPEKNARPTTSKAPATVTPIKQRIDSAYNRAVRSRVVTGTDAKERKSNFLQYVSKLTGSTITTINQITDVYIFAVETDLEIKDNKAS